MKAVTSRNAIDWGAARARKHLLSMPALTLAVALSLGAAPATEAAQVEALDPIALPSGFLYPNGITQAPDGTLFVGSVVSGEVVTVGNEGVARFDAEDPSVFAGTSLRMDANARRLWGSSPDFLGVEQPDGSIHRRAHRIFARDVDTGPDKIDVLIAIHEVDLKLGVVPKEARQDARQVEASEARRCRDPQEAGRPITERAGHGIGRRDGRENILALAPVERAGIGQRHPPGAPHEERDTKMRLQALDAPAQRRGRQVQLARRGRKVQPPRALDEGPHQRDAVVVQLGQHLCGHRG